MCMCRTTLALHDCAAILGCADCNWTEDVRTEPSTVDKCASCGDASSVQRSSSSQTAHYQHSTGYSKRIPAPRAIGHSSSHALTYIIPAILLPHLHALSTCTILPFLHPVHQIHQLHVHMYQSTTSTVYVYMHSSYSQTSQLVFVCFIMFCI